MVQGPITYQFRDRLGAYLRATENMPDTVLALQDECGMRLVIGDKQDPDDAARSADVRHLFVLCLCGGTAPHGTHIL